MKYGIYLPNYGDEISARSLAELAACADDAGWDGFFIWDHILLSKSQKLPMVDPWVALTAMAMNTERIKLGTTVTPIARRRPWKLARETATLDQLSDGRLILGVGLGEPGEAEFEYFGESSDPKERAARLDEGLDILTGLWRGKPFSYEGEHFQLKKMSFVPTPVQSTHIPIWVGGFWPNKPPFRRAAKWDGVIPLKKEGIWLDPEDVREILEYVHKHRFEDSSFDVVVISNRDRKGKGGLKGVDLAGALADAGATWWLESLYMSRNDLHALRDKIAMGPPT